MLPYCLNMLVLCYYYMQHFAKRANNDDSSLIFWAVWGTSWTCNIWLILLEVRQLKQLSWNLVSYLNDSWNLLFMFSNLVNFWLFYRDYNMNYAPNVAYLASISGLSMLIGLFYWSQMFEKVSMYWRIIMDSVSESMYFVTMVLTALLSFAVATYILDQIL